MAYTTYSQAWLEDSTTVKCILVEVAVKDVVGNSETTMYLSNIGYITADSLTSYKPLITNGVSFTESLPIDGSPTLSFGDIEILNTNGDLDTWLDPTKYIWANRAIQVYLGDPFFVSASRADMYTKFTKIFDGVVFDIDSKDRETLNLKVRDKLERLNTPVTTAKLGTYGVWGAAQTNQDMVLPLVFGEVFNMSPVLIDPSTTEYMVSNSPIENIIELRDNGVPIYMNALTSYGTTNGVTTTAAVVTSTGKLKINAPTIVTGVLTASVQGVNNSINLTTGALVTGTYSNNIANIIALIATQYGVNKLTASELDLTNLNAFATANTQSVGIVVNDSTTVLSACQELANSIGAQLFMNRLGQLQLLRIGSPTADAVVAITDADILHHSLHISNRTQVVASATIGYCRNWTVESNLVTNIYQEDKTSMATELYTKTSLDATVQTNYKLPADAINQKDTLLIIGSEAAAEALRLNNLYKVPRTVYSFSATTKCMSLKLGQNVTLTHNRFGLSGGVTGQVVSLSPDWLNGSITVEVLV